MTADSATGVDIDLGDSCSTIAYRHAQATFAQRDNKAGQVDSTHNLSFANIVEFGSERIAIASDGIGTKVEIAERAKNYQTLGYDLVAMVADDLVCVGAEPTTLSNILDVDRLDSAIVDELMSGLSSACCEAGIAITGGEIAELGDRIGGFGSGMHFNWCATALGTLSDRAPLDGSAVRPGDAIIALQSAGIRSNGLTLARQIVGFDPELLTPSRIFAPGIVQLWNSGLSLHAIAHITGGGIASNLKRVLGGHGAHLNNLFPPHDLMVRLQRQGDIDPATAYRHWNMGNGMLLVAAESDTDRILKILAAGGYSSRVAGYVVTERTITIQSERLIIECGNEDTSH